MLTGWHCYNSMEYLRQDVVPWLERQPAICGTHSVSCEKMTDATFGRSFPWRSCIPAGACYDGGRLFFPPSLRVLAMNLTETRGIVNLLLLLLLIEATVVGTLVARRMRQPPPPMPAAEWLDPLSREDLAELARLAQSDRAEDLLTLGNALLGKGFYCHAELCFQRVRDREPDNREAAHGMAFCLDRTGRLAESIRVYEQLVPNETGEKRQECLFAIGRNYLREEESLKAEQVFEENYDYIPAKLLWNRLLVKTGRAGQALPFIEDFLRTLPNSLRFQQLRLEACQQLGQLDKVQEAADAIERSELLIPVNFSTDFLTLQSQEYGLERHWAEFQKLEPVVDLDQQQRIIAELRDCIRDYLSPYTMVLLTKAAEIASARGDATLLASLLAELEALGEENPTQLRLAGDLALLRGNALEAEELWLRSASMTPLRETHERLAKLYESRGNTNARDGQRARMSLLQGKQHFWENKLADATTSLEQAVELDPSLTDGWFYLGEIRRSRQDADQARDAYRKCLELRPSHGRAMARLALLTE